MSKAGWEGRSVERYRLIRRIGRGGMGEVYLAELEPMPGVRKLAAVKLLRDVGLDPSAERGFAAEAKLAALISHPNVVQLVDAGVSDDVPWLAMEFVAGLSLNEILHASAARREKLPPWISARIIADACAGLHAVHEAKNDRGEPLDIVHRDVTPHNVLIGWDGVVKITDFGVARSTLQSTVTRTGTVKGKLAYMAPEQASGSRVDRRADVFALGVLLWETLSGKKLFKAPNATETLARVLRCEVPKLAEIAPDAPERLAAIAHRALRPDSGSRFATAREMQLALESAMRDAGVALGHAEVAEIVATLVPNRVREHELWVREHDRGKSERSDSADSRVRRVAAPTPTEGTLRTLDTTSVKRARSRLPLIVFAITVAGALGVFAWARSERESPAAEPSAAVRSAAAPAPVEIEPDIPPSAIASAAPPQAQPSAMRAPAPPKPVIAAKPAAAHEYGTLNVGSSPMWATVFVDGRSVGATPIAGLRLRAGAHTVEARAQGKSPVQRRGVKVPPNASTSVHFRFEPN